MNMVCVDNLVFLGFFQGCVGQQVHPDWAIKVFRLDLHNYRERRADGEGCKLEPMEPVVQKIGCLPNWVGCEGSTTLIKE